MNAMRIEAIRDAWLVPGITDADIGELVRSGRYRWPSASKKTKFTEELAACFLWVFQECFGFSASLSDQVLCELDRRETRGTTGIWRGIALPHSHTPDVNLVHVALIHFETRWFAFETIDDEPVYLFGTLVSPTHGLEGHRKAVEVIGFFRTIGHKRLCKDELIAVCNARGTKRIEPPSHQLT